MSRSGRVMRPRPAAHRAGAALTRRRSAQMLALVAVAFAVIAGRLADIQLFSTSVYTRRGAAQDTRTTILPGLRGSILDRSGAALALSEVRYEVIADDYQITAPGPEAARLAAVLHQPATSLAPELRLHSGFVDLAKGVTRSAADAVTALALPGITIRSHAERYYPDGPLAGPVLGAVDASGAGAAGLEYEFNSVMSGAPGRLVQQVDPQGQAIAGGTLEDQPPSMGSDLVLSLDEPLQYQTEQALAQAIVASHGQSGIAMVMNVHTGGLLAVADLSLPTAGSPGPPALPVPIGPGGRLLAPGTKVQVPQPVESPSADAFTSVYEPGSVEKLITVSAALASGTVTPDQVLAVPNTYLVDGIPIHDAENHGSESLSVTGIVAQSSNIGAAEIAGRLGASNLYRYLDAFGLGTPTAVHFPGESAGIVAPRSSVSPVTLATMAYGEGIAVTAIQMISAYNAIANGGVYVAPHLVDATIGPHGHRHPVRVPAPHRVVPASVAGEMTSILEQVVAAGTGTAARAAPYAVAGKTGTAQYDGPKGYVTGRTVASFAGYAPAQNPAVTVMVVISDTADYGGQAAAPAFAAIARDALTDMQIPSDGPQPPPEVTALPRPATLGAPA